MLIFLRFGIIGPLKISRKKLWNEFLTGGCQKYFSSKYLVKIWRMKPLTKNTNKKFFSPKSVFRQKKVFFLWKSVFCQKKNIFRQKSCFSSKNVVRQKSFSEVSRILRSILSVKKDFLAENLFKMFGEKKAVDPELCGAFDWIYGW